jgi:hypothetical protein
MSAPADEAAIREWAAARRLPAPYLARWLELGPEDRAALLETAVGLRMRAGQLIAAFDLMEEISVRDARPVAAILARAEVRRILDGSGSGPGRAAALLGALRAIRFPRLARATERITCEIAALGLPRGIRIAPPRELASGEIRIELAAHGSEDLRGLLDALSRRAAELARIADLVAGVGWNDDEI